MRTIICTSGRGKRHMLSSLREVIGARPRLLAVAGVIVLVAAAVSAALAEWLGASWLGILGTLILVLLFVHVVRSEQQSRRLRREVAAIRSVTSAQRKQIASQRSTLDQVARDTAVTRQRVKDGFANKKTSGLYRDLVETSNRSFHQVQATINLFDMVDVAAPVPSLRGWAVSPDALNLLLREFLDLRPARVVECGSGSSTLFLALAARKFGIDTQIIALDHEDHYATQTNEMLARHGVSHLASARHAPLVDVTTDRGTQPWYDPAALADLADVALVFVDGPPIRIGPLARYPALPLLWDTLAARVSIVLDDANRESDREVMSLWSAAHPELVGEEFDTEKGTYILRRG